MKLPPLVISRTDRMGDLLLSFCTLRHAAVMGFEHRILHIARANLDLGELALYNGLVEELWIAGEEPPKRAHRAAFLSLFHSSDSASDLKKLDSLLSIGPRAKLSALWTYTDSIRQNRSKVLMSECRYNLELLRALAQKLRVPYPDVTGVPALRIPPDWKSHVVAAEVVVNVCNRGSAANWPIEKYIQSALQELSRGRSVDFVASGEDQEQRLRILRAHPDLMRLASCRIFSSFGSLAELAKYLSTAKKVISSSTGTLHLAHALGVEVVGIFPVKKVESFERWRPDGFWHAAPVRLEEILE